MSFIVELASLCTIRSYKLRMKSRVFGALDARAVRQLASRDTPLGRRVRHALEITEEAVARYG